MVSGLIALRCIALQWLLCLCLYNVHPIHFNRMSFPFIIIVSHFLHCIDFFASIFALFHFWNTAQFIVDIKYRQHWQFILQEKWIVFSLLTILVCAFRVFFIIIRWICDQMDSLSINHKISSFLLHFRSNEKRESANVERCWVI